MLRTRSVWVADGLAEVEITGAHTQFFDKFNIRYEIFQVIKCIWSNQIYRMRLSQEAKYARGNVLLPSFSTLTCDRQNLEFFVRFVNLLLNDVTFVLDESLTAFGKIHRLQKELEDGSLAANVRTEREEQLTTAQSMAKGYMQLTNETVSMLKLFTEALADSFTMPEIVQRLADMLDYNVDAMVGPKSRDLKVQNPEQYGFQPRILLSELVDVYLNLGGRSNFVEAVARDGRSYKPANFEKAHAILSKWGLKSSIELGAWSALAEKIRRAKEADDQAEEDLGEIPEEFLGRFVCLFVCLGGFFWEAWQMGRGLRRSANRTSDQTRSCTRSWRIRSSCLRRRCLSIDRRSAPIYSAIRTIRSIGCR